MQARAVGAAPTLRFQQLVRKHVAQSVLIGRIGNNRLAKLALARTRLRGQNVTGKCVPANDFAGSRLLEPLGRTFVCLQFGHMNVLGIPHRNCCGKGYQ